VMLGALTSASRSAASHLRGESPPAGPDTAPAQLAPVSALPLSPILLAMRTTTHESDDEKIAPAAPPLPCAPAAAESQRAVPVLIRHADAPAAGLFQASPEPPRFQVRDELGQPVVARLHGQHEGTTALILPDGQLGIPNMLVPTNEPFQPFTAEELLTRLQKGPLGDFQVHQTAHYLIFYQSSRAFAEAGGRWLEDLYRRLLDVFRKHEMAAHDTEFPLVAVIYRTERDFRASKRVDPEVQSVYEIYTNRIYFYETSEHDGNAPEVSALRKPQTVVHEGTHQVLQNIGVHPRLSAWPIWLVEGLAEYCSTPASPRKVRKADLGRPGDDQRSAHGHDSRARRSAFGRDPRRRRPSQGAGARARQTARGVPGPQDPPHAHGICPGLGDDSLPGVQAAGRLRRVSEGHESDSPA